MNLDVLERARCGERDAYRSLIATWGERIHRTALLLTGDPARAQAVTARTFVTLWPALPSMHSERPFRPRLLRALLDANASTETITGITGDGHDDPSPLWACLAQLDDEARATAVLHLYDRIGAAELALVRDVTLLAAAGQIRAALKRALPCLTAAGIGATERDAGRALAGAARAAELPPWFADEQIMPSLAEPDALEARFRLTVDPAAAWSMLRDPALLEAWVDGDARIRGATTLEAGARVLSSGRIAGVRPSHDETLIACAGDDRTLAWVTRSRIRPWSSGIELRWTLSVAETSENVELVHRLRGVAFPPGMTGRFLRAAYARVAEEMPASMRRGLERLTQAIDARAGRPRRPPL